jgi:RimJ/RimL family protein N-acetyltransferase
MGPFPIASERLQLREFRPEDELDIHAYASDPEVTMHTGWGPNDQNTTRTVLQRWIVDQQAWPRDSIPLGIELRPPDICEAGWAASERSAKMARFTRGRDADERLLGQLQARAAHVPH